MTICFFGNYIPDYPRIVVLKKGFAANGVKVLECHTRKTGVAKYIDLWQQHRKFKNDYDVLLVTMGAYTLVPFARRLTKKKLIFDAFVSLQITADDRGKGRFMADFWDAYACRIADQVLLDTNAQIEYFVARYNLPRVKFTRVPASADPDIFFPTSYQLPPTRSFVVHWHGHIVPFHGLEAVIEAANKLKDHKDIEFRITTRFNSKYQAIKKRIQELKLENVNFFPETSYAGLAKAINESDVVLGVFGTKKKAEVVIPNKIYEAVACKKPVITRDSKAVREVFDENSMKLIRPNNPDELATAILELKQNEAKRNSLAENANEIYTANLLPGAITKPLLE
ncbi:MAG: hypothetical protein A2751_03040 [Candidatus Doudnabacteria bacterium RIFCSPHIGHO2_01_FULL_46_14]|uniref:Glycosyl transferase family 1 domain-containing protein n=1 Tax=Candidatus Doudnabacteria bacterium RIFCSPHIGHO2_01_FULL_46_14 TaxID=1817824 RepID=A0A1F5NKN9_9BACT|nr:MAG: hypothetical protein A2751_03040 [Candidatus Doudnabacteria bacterium RIFCSPHIGHO2_01_FULL_46_14]